jgi:phage-related protein
MQRKRIEWVGNSLEFLRALPADARAVAGRALLKVQQGLPPPDWKPVRAVGPGALELRIHVRGEYRVIYVTTFSEAIYVLHAFHKKTARTRQADIALARVRFQHVWRARSGWR